MCVRFGPNQSLNSCVNWTWIYIVSTKEFIVIHPFYYYQVLIHINNSTLHFKMNKLLINGLYCITILDKLGCENMVVGFLSWLPNTFALVLVDDTSLYVHPKTIFFGLDSYIVNIKFPLCFSLGDHKRIIG